MSRAYHLAQLNIARLRAPLDDPRLAGFVGQLDALNEVADRSLGFVWRLVSDGADNATALRPYEDDLMLVNLSVWESIEALHSYVYRSQHVAIFRERAQWFEPSNEPTTVLWWVPAGHRPDVAEGQARLALLRERGASPRAFTFRRRYPPPDSLA